MSNNFENTFISNLIRDFKNEENKNIRRVSNMEAKRTQFNKTFDKRKKESKNFRNKILKTLNI